MAESAKVRLVRCPKCENLLSELEDYSVYQCGGCGAVLRAKINHREADSVSDKSKEERTKGTSSKSGNSSDKGIMDSSEPSDLDVLSNASSLRHEEQSPEDQHQSQARSEAWVAEDDPCMNTNRGGSGSNPMVRDQEDSDSQSGLQRSGKILNQRSQEKVGADGLRKRITPRNDFEGVRLSTSNYPQEGTFLHYSDSSNDIQKPLTNQNDQSIDRDRTELVRRLDELEEQLARSCNVVDKSKEKVPSSSLGSDKPFFVSSKHVAGPSYYHHYPEPAFPCTNGHAMPMQGVLHPSVHNASQVPGYVDPFGFQMHRRPPQPSHPYYSGQYVDNNHDLFEPYLQNGIFHQHSCSCFHCYEKHRRAPVLPPQRFSELPPQRFSDVPYDPSMYPHENVGLFGPHNYNPRTFVPHHPSSSHGSQAYARWPSDIGPDRGGLASLPKVALTGGISWHIRPLAGGAPFLTCQNCFELLHLPKNANLSVKKKQKLRCGACSSVIDFSIVDKKLIFSVNAETKLVSKEEMDNHVHRVTSNFSSDDYDNSGYEFHSMDRETIELSTGQGLNSGKPQEMQNLHSPSPTASEDEHSSDSLNAKPTLPGSPLQDNFDYSSVNHAVQNHFGIGNRSARSEQDKVIPNKVATRQNSLKEASVVATELELLFNEYSNTTGVSHDSRVGTREDDQVKPKKGGESFFANIVKKSFKDLKKSGQNEERGKSNVWVNGHSISERLVKKAEKQAGTIQPGNYWYDHRAGFWGVMDGPCLGIIPPFIEELNHPMPDNCSHGNTGVFVNGRELHQKDLDLLVTRGLPTDNDRSYILDISGRVLDEDTGEELDSLGKLAPTVEKVKRGFGMKVPRSSCTKLT